MNTKSEYFRFKGRKKPYFQFDNSPSLQEHMVSGFHDKSSSYFVCSNKTHILGHKGQTGKVKLHYIAFLTRILLKMLFGFFIFFKFIMKISHLPECFYYCKEGKSLFSKTVSLKRNCS